jgi:hypothetical protein
LKKVLCSWESPFANCLAALPVATTSVARSWTAGSTHYGHCVHGSHLPPMDHDRRNGRTPATRDATGICRVRFHVLAAQRPHEMVADVREQLRTRNNGGQTASEGGQGPSGSLRGRRIHTGDHRGRSAALARQGMSAGPFAYGVAGLLVVRRNPGGDPQGAERLRSGTVHRVALPSAAVVETR